jgi:hypothetical protein
VSDRPGKVVMEVECEGFTFTSKFDSGNLAEVEYVPKNKSGKCVYKMPLK